MREVATFYSCHIVAYVFNVWKNRTFLW